MKYFVSNGNAYINFPNIDNDGNSSRGVNFANHNKYDYKPVNKLTQSTLFRSYETAYKYLINSMLDIGIWNVQRYCGNKRNEIKFYVITNCNSFVSNDCNKIYSNKYSGCKWFKNINDVINYIINRKPYPNSYVFDEHLNLVDMSQYKDRSFTNTQLNAINVKIEKTSPRIMISKNIRNEVYQRDKGICGICGRHVGSNWTIDHIIPLSRGGDNSIDNFRIACDSCNRIKDNMKDFEMLKSIGSIFSHTLIEQNDQNTNQDTDNAITDTENMMIRAIVRKRINSMFAKSEHVVGQNN